MDENQNYTFTGNTADLAKSVSAAIALLNKYAVSVQRIQNTDMSNKQALNLSKLKTNFIGISKELGRLKNLMKNATKMDFSPGSQSASLVAAVVAELNDSLSLLKDESGDVGAKFSKLATNLNNTEVALRNVIKGWTTAATAAHSYDEQVSAGVAQSVKSHMATGKVSEAAKKAAETVSAEAKKIRENTNSKKSNADVTVRSAAAEKNHVEVKRKSAQAENAKTSATRRTTSATVAGTTAVAKNTQSENTNAQTKKRATSATVAKVAAVAKETQSLGTNTQATAKVNSAATKLNTTFKNTSNVATLARNSFGGVKNTLNGLTTNLNKTSVAANLVKRAFSGITALMIGRLFASMAKESIDYVETLNLFKVAMGESLQEGKEFVSTMQELYGMDPAAIMKYVGVMNQLAVAIDAPASAAKTMSLGLTKVGVDISSLFEMDIETVMGNLEAGMQGMTRAVRKYGLDLRTTTLQQEAAALGIYGNVEAMKEANRQGLRYITIMKQASNASGDFAKTIESPANQLRIFQEQIKQLGRAIGTFLVVPLQRVLPYINGVIMAFKTMITILADLFGFEPMSFASSAKEAEETAEAVGGIGDSAVSSAKKIKNMLAPFDELNILKEESADAGSGGGGGVSSDAGTMDPKIQAAVEALAAKFEMVEMKANKVRDSILAFFGIVKTEGDVINKAFTWHPDVFEANLIDKFPGWSKTITAAFDSWTGIVLGFKRVCKSLGDVLDTVKEKIVAAFSKNNMDEKLSSFLENFSGNLTNLAKTIEDNKGPIANFLLVLAGLVAGFKGLSIIGGIVAPIIKVVQMLAPIVSTIAGIAGPLLGTIAIIAAVIAGLVIVYQNSEDFRTSIAGLMSALGEGLATTFGSIKELLTTVWDDVSSVWESKGKPLLETIGRILGKVVDTITPIVEFVFKLVADIFGELKKAWDEYGKPIFEGFIDAVQSLMDIFEVLWDTTIEPIVKSIMDILKELWENHLKKLVGQIMGAVMQVIQVILEVWNVLSPLVKWLVEIFGPVVSSVFNTIGKFIGAIIGTIIDIISGLFQMLKGLINFIMGVFTGDWKRAWEGIKDIFGGIWEVIKGVFKGVVNGIIGIANMLITAVCSGINAIIRLLNKLKVTMPDWVPLLGGKTLGFNIPTMTPPTIPYLANGAIVNGPTVAMVGEAGPEAVVPLDRNGGLGAQIAGVVKSAVNDGEVASLLRRLLDEVKSGKILAVDRDVLAKIVSEGMNAQVRMAGYTPVDL